MGYKVTNTSSDTLSFTKKEVLMSLRNENVKVNYIKNEVNMTVHGKLSEDRKRGRFVVSGNTSNKTSVSFIPANVIFVDLLRNVIRIDS